MQISEVSSDHSANTDNELGHQPTINVSPSLQKLEKLVAEVMHMAPMISPETVQKLRELIPSFQNSRLNEDQRSRIWKLARHIWNTCVEISNLQRTSAQRTVAHGGNEGDVEEEGDEDVSAKVVINEEQAKLRHVASDLLLIAGTVGGSSVHSSLLQTAMFFYRTGTIWHNLHNYAMAMSCFDKATELGNRSKDHHEGISITSRAQTEEEEKFLFDLYLARAKTAWELQQKALSRSLLGRARGLLRLLDSPTCSHSAEMYQILAKDCLLFGKGLLAMANKASYAESISFLEQAFEICSEGLMALQNSSIKSLELSKGKEGPSKQLNSLKFDILRFLAAGHLHNENFESVLKCVEILKSGPDHACIPYLALKAYLGLSRFEEAEKELFILSAQRFSTAKICAGAISALIESCISSGRPLIQDAIAKAFSIVRSRFPTNKDFVLSVLENLLRTTNSRDQQFKERTETALLIATDEDVVQSIAAAKSSSNGKATYINQGDTRVKSDQDSDANAQRSVHCLLWNSAQEFFQAKDYLTATKLFEAALMYLSPNDNDYAQLRAKNLRILCICHLASHEYDRASDYVDEANKIEPNIVGAFLKYKIYLQTNDEERATKEVEQMFNCPNFEPDYLTLASHEAISCKCFNVAIAALSRMLEMPSCSSLSSDSRREAVIIRNIIALCAQESRNELTMILKYFNFARSRLAEVGSVRFFGSGSMGEKEAQWYAGSSWNHGLDTAQSQKWSLCIDFLKCAADFYEVLPGTLENLELRRTSMLLAVSATLIGGTYKEEANSNAVIREAALYLDKCVKVHQSILSKSSTISANNDTIEAHLSLISFEVKRRLKDYKAQLDIIRHCSTLPGFHPKYFFSMGSTAYNNEASEKNQSNNDNYEVAMAAFDAGLNITLSSPLPDYGLVSATIRTLINLGDSKQRDGPKVMSFYRQAHQILLGLGADVYPKEEIQWLISTAWNRGSLHARFSRFTMAEKWMNLALDMLKHIAPAMEAYRPLMMENLSLVLKGKADEPSPMDE